MSDLLVMGFDDPYKADKVLAEVLELQKEHLVDLEDAAVVVRDTKGKVRIKQTRDLSAVTATGGFWWGGLWGLLLGWLVLNPLLGWAAGAGLGTAIGWLHGRSLDLGINDQFMKELGETLKPGSSAIFVLIRKATVDRVIDELKPFGGKILHTSLSKEDERKLREALEAGAATVSA
ncbi:MAG: membrane protein [Phycisphaerales bacterium]|nr:MAG: membrane protein [Phycisphaerales bacterium]